MRGLRHVLGKASEEAVKEEFLKKGYQICKCVKQRKGNSWFVCLNRDEINKNLLNYKGDKQKLLKIMEDNVKGLPDFLIFDKDSLFFLEVKSSKKGKRPIFSDIQLKTFKLLEKEGYKVRWYHMTINLKIKKDRWWKKKEEYPIRFNMKRKRSWWWERR